MLQRFIAFLLALLVASSPAAAVDINGELKKAQLEKLSSDPTGTEARLYYNTSSKKAKLYNGTAWGELGGSGSGEKNYVTAPSTATGWTTSGTVTATTTTTGANLPRENTTGTGISLASGSAADYVAYCFTIDDADKSRKLKVQWDQKPSSYATGDFDIQVSSFTSASCGGSETALYNNNGETSTDIPNYEGMFAVSFDTTTTDYYGIKFIRRAGSSTLVVSDVVVGPGIRASGAIVGSWYSCTFTGNWSTNTTYTAYCRRVGESLDVDLTISLSGAPDAATLNALTLPTGLTLDASRTSDATPDAISMYYGTGTLYDDSAGSTLSAVVANADATPAGNDLRVLGLDDGATGVVPISVSNTAPWTWASLDRIHLKFTVPILEWRGGGTVNLIQDETLQEPIAYTPSFGGLTSVSLLKATYQRVGSNMRIRGSANATGAVGATITIPLPTGYTIDTTNLNSSATMDLLGYASALDDSAGTFYTGGIYFDSTTTVRVRPSGSTGSWNATTPFTWASADDFSFDFTVPIEQWRGKGIGAIGFGLATTTNAGLRYKPQYVTDASVTGIADATYTTITGTDNITLDPATYLICYGSTMRVESSVIPTYAEGSVKLETTGASLIQAIQVGLARAESARNAGTASSCISYQPVSSTTIRLQARISVVGGTVTSRDARQAYIRVERIQ